MFPYRPGCSVRGAGVDSLEGDAVLGSVGVVGHRGVVKPVAPEYLGGQIAGPHLDGAAGVGGRPLQRDDDLRLAGGQVPGRVEHSRSESQLSYMPYAINARKLDKLCAIRVPIVDYFCALKPLTMP